MSEVKKLTEEFSDYSKSYNNSRQRFLETMIYLLQQEVESLRSVLSEYGADHNQFTQWMRAEDLRRVIEGMEYKL